MPLSVACSSYGAKLRAPDNAIGRTFKCPNCGNQLAVAAVSASRVERLGSPRMSEALDDVSIKRRAEQVAPDAVSEARGQIAKQKAKEVEKNAVPNSEGRSRSL
jgi:predicted RNA-binding Zn-ribbon protein involved in translation (DUF1610 family)